MNTFLLGGSGSPFLFSPTPTLPKKGGEMKNTENHKKQSRDENHHAKAW